jgi:hypothetical protein
LKALKSAPERTGDFDVTSFGAIEARSNRDEPHMEPASFVLWACSLARAACGVPDITVIQSAYEQEVSNGSKLHDRGLRVLEASCERGTAGNFLCQVTFLSKDDPGQRLYFDVVAVARTDKGWELQSGLCKR